MRQKPVRYGIWAAALLFSLKAVLPSVAVTPLRAYAQEEMIAEIPDEVIVFPEEPSAETENLFAGYVEQVLYEDARSEADEAYYAPRRAHLNENQLAAYGTLRREIIRIAAGERSDTIVEVPFDRIFGKTEFTYEELGLTQGASAEEIRTAISAMTASLDSRAVSRALLSDLPYELYWHDKTIGSIVSYPRYSYGNTTVRMLANAVTFKFTVSTEFSPGGESRTYVTDTAKTGAAVNAKTVAGRIVADHASLADAEKLAAYRDEICALTSYNYAATATGFPYGNPWQLLYVFDGDPDTTVVCEGYAKAFKLLCDLSTFQSERVECHLMSGTTSDKHMWNVVRMDNGHNYLVDVTNSDIGDTASEQFFLKGAPSGTADGYSVSGLNYVYNEFALSMFTVQERTLSTGNSYAEDVANGVPAATDTPVTGVRLYTDSAQVMEEETLQLTAVTLPADATNQRMIWTSSDPSVAEVSGDGLVTGKAEGTCTITVETADGSHTASCSVAVTPRPTYTITASPATLSFGTLVEGYRVSAGRTVTVQNTGNADVTLLIPAASKYTITGAATAVSAGESVTFTIQPVANLAVGTHNEMLTFQTAQGTQATVNCTLTVRKKTPDELLKEFIGRAYKEILGRDAETSGMNYWLGELKAGRLGGADLCASFMKQPEFQNKGYSNETKVLICYKVFFNRDANADAAGKKYWTDLLDNGVSESYIALGMATAGSEFRNICNRYGISQGDVRLTENRDKNTKVTAFVARCYKESLGRPGDKSGLNYWTGALLNRQITPARVAEQFVFSKEMNNKGYDNSRFVQMLYRLCMGRTYDQAGLNYWLGRMNGGMTRQQVFTSFVNSQEFRNIVASYGL